MSVFLFDIVYYVVGWCPINEVPIEWFAENDRVTVRAARSKCPVLDLLKQRKEKGDRIDIWAHLCALRRDFGIIIQLTHEALAVIVKMQFYEVLTMLPQIDFADSKKREEIQITVARNVKSWREYLKAWQMIAGPQVNTNIVCPIVLEYFEAVFPPIQQSFE